MIGLVDTCLMSDDQVRQALRTHRSQGMRVIRIFGFINGEAAAFVVLAWLYLVRMAVYC